MVVILNASCSLCSNSSGYDTESLKASTWNINGSKRVLCCPCEDDLKLQLVTTFDTDVLRTVSDKFQISFDHLEEILNGLRQETYKVRHGDKIEL